MSDGVSCWGKKCYSCYFCDLSCLTYSMHQHERHAFTSLSAFSHIAPDSFDPEKASIAQMHFHTEAKYKIRKILHKYIHSRYTNIYSTLSCNALLYNSWDVHQRCCTSQAVQIITEPSLPPNGYGIAPLFCQSTTVLTSSPTNLIERKIVFSTTIDNNCFS